MAQTAITATEILEAALIGLRRQRSDIDERMAELRRELGIRRGARVSSIAPDGTAPVRKRRRMSAAGRRRIAAAQRKRWAAAKASPDKKRRISAAGMKRIIAATKKRWAEYRAKKAAAAKK